MAAIAENQLMKVGTLTVGVDTYPGVRTFSYRRAKKKYYPARAEGSLVVTRHEQIPSEESPVNGSIGGKTVSMDALAGVSQASVTLAGINALTGAAVTVTLTNVEFNEFAGGGNETDPGQSSLGYVATQIAIV